MISDQSNGFGRKIKTGDKGSPVRGASGRLASANHTVFPKVFMSDSEKEDAGRSSPIPSRHEKSLGLLTAKFVEMLKNADGGLLDLKKACYTCM